MIIELSSNKWKNVVYDAIMIIINRYFKMTIYIFIKFTINVKKICNLLCDKIFLKFESSKKIILNKNSLFTNNFWFTFCFHTRVKRRLNIIFYSQINEQTKRQNQILKHYLKIFCNYEQNNWIVFLFFATFVYNCAKHALIEFVSFATIMNYVTNFQWKFDIAKFDVQSTKKKSCRFLKKNSNWNKIWKKQIWRK